MLSLFLGIVRIGLIALTCPICLCIPPYFLSLSSSSSPTPLPVICIGLHASAYRCWTSEGRGATSNQQPGIKQQWEPGAESNARKEALDGNIGRYDSVLAGNDRCVGDCSLAKR